MRIIDCFTFFNEVDLLEFRLQLLDGTVEKFVIAESNLTHAGHPKSYIFEANQHRFSRWKEKIEYIKVHQTTEGLDLSVKVTSYDPGSASWKLENGQRNALSDANCWSNSDLVIVGDLDEMPDPVLLKRLRVDQPSVLSQLFHYYFMNCQNTGTERWWNGSIICRGEDMNKFGAQQLRDKRNELPVLKKHGWHFSYLGGLEKIRYKIQSFAHTEFNRHEYTSDENIIRAMEKGEDLFRRPGVRYSFVPLSYYPRQLRSLMEAYPQFIHPIRANIFQRLKFGLQHFIGIR